MADVICIPLCNFNIMPLCWHIFYMSLLLLFWDIWLLKLITVHTTVRQHINDTSSTLNNTNFTSPPYIRIKTPELITKRCHIVTINEFQMKCKSIHGSFCTSASLMHTHFCSFQYTIIYYVNNFYQLLMRRQSSRCNDDRITRISMRPIHRLHQVWEYELSNDRNVQAETQVPSQTVTCHYCSCFWQTKHRVKPSPHYCFCISLFRLKQTSSKPPCHYYSHSWPFPLKYKNRAKWSYNYFWPFRLKHKHQLSNHMSLLLVFWPFLLCF